MFLRPGQLLDLENLGELSTPALHIDFLADFSVSEARAVLPDNCLKVLAPIAVIDLRNSKMYIVAFLRGVG